MLPVSWVRTWPRPSASTRRLIRGPPAAEWQLADPEILPATLDRIDVGIVELDETAWLWFRGIESARF
jgi:hypothetical protein